MTMGESRWAAISADAIDDRELTLTDFRTLGCIGYHSDRSRGAWPKQQTIADRLGVTREAVNRSIKRLTDKGYIRAVHQHRTDGGQRESRYFVLLDPQEVPQAAVAPPSLDPQPAPPPVIARSHPPVTSKITPPVISEITPIEDEHTIRTHPLTPNGVGRECEKGSEKVEGKAGQDFEALWSLWPAKGRKRSAGMAACLKAFEAALAEHAPAAIVGAARAFLSETDPAYAPGLNKWLATRQFEHFIKNPNSATNGPAPTLAGPTAPTDGRAGACFRALVERFGERKINAWLAGAAWRESELLLESEYARQRVENEFGGILRLFEIEATAAA